MKKSLRTSPHFVFHSLRSYSDFQLLSANFVSRFRAENEPFGTFRLSYTSKGRVMSIRIPIAVIRRKNNPTPGSITPFSILEM